jgi:regulator of G-protein signaling
LQLKIAKDRKKGEKIVTDSQEKAYWRVYRPPPGYTTVVESSPVPTREQRSKARSRTREHLTDEVLIFFLEVLIFFLVSFPDNCYHTEALT